MRAGNGASSRVAVVCTGGGEGGWAGMDALWLTIGMSAYVLSWRGLMLAIAYARDHILRLQVVSVLSSFNTIMI